MLKKLIRGLVETFGLKRQLAAALQTVALLSSVEPHLAFIAPYISGIADYVGIVGLTHAAAGKTIKVEKVASLAALLSALALVAESGLVPALTPFAPILRKVALLVAPIATGIFIGSNSGDDILNPEKRDTAEVERSFQPYDKSVPRN